MKVNELQINKHKRTKRLGRGIASGRGKTAGRGTKGQKSRTGSRKRPGFAGGQNPLMQQLPKLPGFKSYRKKPAIVFTGQLSTVKSSIINAESLTKASLISNPYQNIKLLSRGELNKSFKVELPSASSKAIEQIEKAGGSFKKIERISRPAKTKDPI